MDTRNKIRSERTRTPKFATVSRAHGAGTATTDGAVGEGGRSTGKSFCNSPTFAGFPGTRSETCLRSSGGVHPAHPILHKHTGPVGTGCSLTAPVLCPCCPVLHCGHRTRCVTEHPGTDGDD